jgi:hypothetical protein
MKALSMWVLSFLLVYSSDAQLLKKIGTRVKRKCGVESTAKGRSKNRPGIG